MDYSVFMHLQVRSSTVVDDLASVVEVTLVFLLFIRLLTTHLNALCPNASSSVIRCPALTQL